MKIHYRSLCGHRFSFLLGRYLGEEMLGQVVALCLTIRGTVIWFPKWPHFCMFPPAMCSSLSSSVWTLVKIHLFNLLAQWWEVEVHLVLICISLMVNDVEHLFICLLAIFLLWRNSCPSYISKIRLFFKWLNCKSHLYTLDPSI